MPNSISDEIKARAKAEGFDVVRFVSAEASPHNVARLREFLVAGHHGEMDWTEQRQAWRADPRSLWPEARSVIVLGINYGPKDDPLALLTRPDKGAISVYARGDDYHDLVKKKLGLQLTSEGEGENRVYRIIDDETSVPRRNAPKAK